MLKALIGKQFSELGSFYFRRKNGGKLEKGGIIGFAVLYAFVYISIAFSFFSVAQLLAGAFLGAGLSWLYFSMLGILAVTLSVFINSLSSYALLYSAKDNELLLSMPIPPSKILFSRVLTVYAMGVVFESVVLLPAIIIYFMFGFGSASQLIISLVMFFAVSLFVLALTCAVGFVVAKASSKLKNKSIVTTVVSLLLVFVIYYCQFKLNTFLQLAAQNAEKIGTFVKSYLFPFYHMGQGFAGKIGSVLIFTAISAVLIAAVYCLLSKSFVSIATENRGAKKKVYREKAAKSKGIVPALTGKELSHFTASSIYMLNSGIGIFILAAGSVFAAVRFNWLSAKLGETFESAPPELKAALPVIIACGICLILSMNNISAPSISLEGKNLWLIRSLPVKAEQVFLSKLRAHVLLNIFPALAAVVLLEAAAGAKATEIIPACILVVCFVFLGGLVGLVADIKKPNFTWTNETVPVKQSMSVAISMFGGWIVSAGTGALYFAVGEKTGKTLFLCLASAVIAAADIAAAHWIKTKGTAIFDEL